MLGSAFFSGIKGKTLVFLILSDIEKSLSLQDIVLYTSLFSGGVGQNRWFINTLALKI